MKFIRQDIHKKKKLKEKWRKPRGCDSKKRLRMQNRVIVSPGYGKKDRGTHYSGKDIVVVKDKADIEKLDEKKHIVKIPTGIGFRKKKILLEALDRKGIKVMDIEVKKYIEVREKRFALKKKETKKEDKKQTKEETKDSIEDKLSEEDKKKVEKKEIDRLLTKKF